MRRGATCIMRAFPITYIQSELNSKKTRMHLSLMKYLARQFDNTCITISSSEHRHVIQTLGGWNFSAPYFSVP